MSLPKSKIMKTKKNSSLMYFNLTIIIRLKFCILFYFLILKALNFKLQKLTNFRLLTNKNSFKLQKINWKWQQSNNYLYICIINQITSYKWKWSKNILFKFKQLVNIWHMPKINLNWNKLQAINRKINVKLLLYANFPSN